MRNRREKIKGFLFTVISNRELKDDDDIFALGYVNSMFAMELVLFLENEFRITIEREDLDYNNFKSVHAMASLIERKNDIKNSISEDKLSNFC